MHTGVMITNGGPHSADDWAISTAEHIIRAISIAEDSPNRAKLEVERRKAELAIVEILTGHHGVAQDNCRCGAHHGCDFETITNEVMTAVEPLLQTAVSQKLIPGFLESPVPDSLTFLDHLRLGIRQKVEMDINTIAEIEAAYQGA